MILAAREVSRIFRAGTRHAVPAVVDVSLGVPRGSTTLIRGASGSGKTTLLCLLGTLLRPTSGSILLDGADLAGASDASLTRIRRHRLGFVFQEHHLIPRLPAWRNASYPLVPHVPSEAQRRERALRLLGELGLTERATHAPEELSGGEQQRVAIARALIGGPEILLADEPTASLDEDSIQGFLAILGRLRRGGMTIVLVSHDPRLQPIADPVYTLDRGRLLAG